MPTITDAQVEVAEGAYWAVETQPNRTPLDAMRAALEAYERVRDVEKIFDTSIEAIQGRVNLVQASGNVDCLEQTLQDVRNRLGKEYPR